MNIEKRKQFIINTIFVAFIIILFYLFLKYALGLFFPFLVGLFIAMLLQKPLAFISKHTKIPRKIVGAILTVLTFVLIFALIATLGVAIVSQFKGLFSYIGGILNDFPAFLDTIQSNLISMLSFLPENLSESVNQTIINGFKNLKNINFANFNITSLFGPLGGIWNAAKQIPNVLVTTLITIITTLFLTMDYRLVVNFIRNQLSEKHKALVTDSKKIFFNTIWKMLRAYVIIMTITCVELFIGLSILKVPYALVLALIICIVDILPVLGTGTVIIPWAIYEFIMGNSNLALGLAVMYVLITVIRNFIEPKIVGHSVGLHPIVTLTSMYVGLQLFGFFGMLMMPIIIIMIKVLQDNGKIHLWKNPSDHDTPASENSTLLEPSPVLEPSSGNPDNI